MKIFLCSKQRALQTSVAELECLSRIPDFSILDLGSKKRRGKISCLTFFCSHKFNNVLYIYLHLNLKLHLTPTVTCKDCYYKLLFAFAIKWVISFPKFKLSYFLTGIEKVN